MKKKILLIIFIFFLIVIFQKSFLPSFQIKGVIPSFPLILVFLLNFFDKEKEQFTLPLTIAMGVILDIFSTYPFGTFTISIILTVLFIKQLNRNFEKSNFLWLALSFLGFWFTFKIILSISIFFFELAFSQEYLFKFPFHWYLFTIGYFYNFFFLFLISPLWKKYAQKKFLL